MSLTLTTFTGLEPGGGYVPFRQVLGSLDFLDRRQYIQNMTIHSHLLTPDRGATP